MIVPPGERRGSLRLAGETEVAGIPSKKERSRGFGGANGMGEQQELGPETQVLAMGNKRQDDPKAPWIYFLVIIGAALVGVAVVALFRKEDSTLVGMFVVIGAAVAVIAFMDPRRITKLSISPKGVDVATTKPTQQEKVKTRKADTDLETGETRKAKDVLAP